MQSYKISTEWFLQPSQNRIIAQPLGIIGIMSPWNFPFLLSIAPLISAIAAGNQIMLKPSEYTPSTNQMIKKLIHLTFKENTVSMIEGDADIGNQFSLLPFDHLFFTGSIPVGKIIMANAAQNLTPVTLELGGKSPAIIDNEIDIHDAVGRLIWGKSVNSGQICIAPDYVFIHHSRVDEFIASYHQQFQSMYPNALKNNNYTALINEKQYHRMQILLEDAKEKGAKLHPVNSIYQCDKTHKVLPILISNVTTDMRVIDENEEIFGPLLPIMTYDRIDEAIHFIAQRAKPLTLYLFSYDKKTQEKIIYQTHSGSICINDAITQIASEYLPFGGTKESGMGQYHGIYGFNLFSHNKPIVKKYRSFYTSSIIHAPYRHPLYRMFKKLLLK